MASPDTNLPDKLTHDHRLGIKVNCILNPCPQKLNQQISLFIYNIH